MASKTKVRPADEAKLNLTTIRDLSNGQAEAVINAAIQAAIRDLEDRGGDKKPRKVSIEMEFKKLGEDVVTATVKAKTTLPPYVTQPTFGTLNVDGTAAHMKFNPNNADDYEQQTLPMPGDKGEDE
jgi:hypothetical protein